MDAYWSIIATLEFQGEFASIRPLIEEYQAAAVRQRYERSRVEALVKSAGADLASGDCERALCSVEEATAMLDQHPAVVDKALEVELHGIRCITHLRMAAPEEALAAADKAVAVTSLLRPNQFSLVGYSGPAEVYLSLAESAHPSPRLNERARAACRLLGRYTNLFPIGAPRKRLYDGLSYWQQRRPEKAFKAWQESIDAAGRLGMRYDQALAHYEVGRHLPASDPDRSTHLRHARELFQTCGAVYNLELARQALAADT
jgi:tetratricopeptide (TPR) repeat protein